MIEEFLIHTVPLIGKTVIILDKQQYLVMWAMQWAGLASSGRQPVARFMGAFDTRSEVRCRLTLVLRVTLERSWLGYWESQRWVQGLECLVLAGEGKNS